MATSGSAESAEGATHLSPAAAGQRPGNAREIHFISAIHELAPSQIYFT
jgi:hypothetical protein